MGVGLSLLSPEQIAGVSLFCRVWPAGHGFYTWGSFPFPPVSLIFRLGVWRQGDRPGLEWFSSWRKADTRAHQRLRTTSILDLPCGLGMLPWELCLESRSLTLGGRKEVQVQAGVSVSRESERVPRRLPIWLAWPPPQSQGRGCSHGIKGAMNLLSLLSMVADPSPWVWKPEEELRGCVNRNRGRGPAPCPGARSTRQSQPGTLSLLSYFQGSFHEAAASLPAGEPFLALRTRNHGQALRAGDRGCGRQ